MHSVLSWSKQQCHMWHFPLSATSFGQLIGSMFAQNILYVLLLHSRHPKQLEAWRMVSMYWEVGSVGFGCAVLVRSRLQLSQVPYNDRGIRYENWNDFDRFSFAIDNSFHYFFGLLDFLNYISSGFGLLCISERSAFWALCPEVPVISFEHCERYIKDQSCKIENSLKLKIKFQLVSLRRAMDACLFYSFRLLDHFSHFHSLSVTLDICLHFRQWGTIEIREHSSFPTLFSCPTILYHSLVLLSTRTLFWYSRVLLLSYSLVLSNPTL